MVEMEHQAVDSVPLIPYGAAEVSGSSQKYVAQPRFLGKPGQRARASLSDALTILVSFVCFGFGISAVANNAFAAQLGQTNQLVILGFVLSIMSLLSFKQAQILMLVLEARFGQSTLQNYDGMCFHPDFYVFFHASR